MNDYSPKYAADALRKLCSTIAKDNYVDTTTPKGSYSTEEILLLMEQYGRIIHKNGESVMPEQPTIDFEELYGTQNHN